MNSYCAFLGHQPAISLAELHAVLPDIIVEHTADKGMVVLFSSATEIDQTFFDHLGGTVLIAKRFSSNVLELRDVPNLLLQRAELCEKNKITFSLRTVGLGPKDTLNAYRDCKDYLRKHDYSSRYLGNEKKSAPAAALFDHNMIDGKGGSEITIVRLKQETDIVLWIGYTVAAQNVNAYTKRDMYKPVRDTAVGLLPPKLAQILLNFGVFALQNLPGEDSTSRKKSDSLSIYDPFCGTGVILLEALLAGYEAHGSDVSQKAVADSTANIEWLRKEYPHAAKPWSVHTHDATKTFTTTLKPSVIVTETTLGPNLHKRATAQEAQRYATELEAIEAAFLQNAAKKFPGMPIVCIFPVWYSTTATVRLQKIWKKITELGYDAILPTESAARDTVSIIYRRPEQFVGREIVILVPKHRA
jgi:hypothetical protein